MKQMKKMDINPGFEYYRGFISNIRNNFTENGVTLKEGRNTIKIIEYKGVKFCVKSFGNKNRINAIAYSFIRPSKAVRSFNYALRILSLGVKTPEPVAFVDYYKNSILDKSFYISIFQKHDFSLGQSFDLPLAERLEVLSSFAAFACMQLHNNGIYHKDLSPGNILVTQKPDESYVFHLIDLNRIKFKKKMGFRTRMSNLRRINGTAMCLGTIAHFYAMHHKKNPVWGALRIGVERIKYEKFRKVKKRCKRLTGLNKAKQDKTKETTLTNPIHH